MNVLLIALPTPFLQLPMNPPLGLAYIGATLKKHGHKVTVIDFAVLDYDYNESGYLDEIKSCYDFYGIYCTSAQFGWLKQVCGHIRTNINEKVLVVVGGPHATAKPEECVSAGASVAIRGEGENAIIDILNGVSFRDIEGACYRKGLAFFTSERASIKRLDDLPDPDLSLFDMAKYHRKLCGERAVHITTLRGCPYDCHFCNSEIVGRDVRYISVGKVMTHIDHIMATYGIKNFYIYDDIFTLRKPRLKQFCEEFVKRGIRWRCWTRSDLLDEESLQMMKDSGLESIAMGIESGDDTILKNINKKSSVEDNRNALLLCKKLGVPVRCSLMFGNPGESEETLKKTVELIRETQPDEWNLSILVPTPGSEFWENPEKHGLLFDKDGIKKNLYRDLTRSGESGMGNLLISLETLPETKIKTVLKKFVADLEEACPRNKIRDTIQTLKTEVLE